MNFDFDTEQYALRDSVRAFLADHAGPRQARAAGARFDETLWRGLVDLGLTTLLVPESHGGSGLTLVDFVLVLEEFGRALVPAAVVDTVLASEVLARHGSAAQRQSLLPRIAEGACRVALAHAEAGRGPATDEVATTATRGADGSWQLAGRKILVPCAGTATHLLVSARAAGGAALYLCDAEAAGITIASHAAVDAHALLAEVRLDGVRAVPVGDAPSPWALHRLLETSALAAAAQMAGITGVAMEIAVEYAKQRSQFGRPIGSFQAVKHKCADMVVAHEGACSAAYYAAWALAEDDADAPRAVSLAKAACGDACRQVCNEAIQVHGGVGFTWEFDIHFFMRRGRLLDVLFGDPSLHRERIARIVLDGETFASAPASTAARAAAVAA